MQSILQGYKLILGSGSPRRSDILTQSDLPPHAIRVSDADESYDKSMDVFQVASYLAEVKANALQVADDELLITADTVVIYNGEIYGKPADRQAAIDTINSLQGKKHTVVSGVHLRTNKKQMTISDSTEVSLAEMSLEEISHYVDQYQPMDKAGSYGIQDWLGICRVAGINGSYTNVMGLPMCKTYDAIKAILS